MRIDTPSRTSTSRSASSVRRPCPMPARGLAALTALSLLAALAPAAAGAPPPPILVADGWEISQTPDDPRSWRPAPVPGVIEPAPLERYFGGTVAWYRVTFTGPPTPPGFAWALRF